MPGSASHYYSKASNAPDYYYTLEIGKMGSIFHEAFPYMGLAYVELPDLSLSALQDHFREELETLYKRYEQRFQIGKWNQLLYITSFNIPSTFFTCIMHAQCAYLLCTQN